MRHLPLICLLLVTGCSAPLPPAGASLDRHFRFSDELRSVMRRMDSLVHERELTAGEIRRLRLQQARALGRVAEELQQVTDELLLAPGGPDAAQREEFRALAAALVTQAGLVSEAAAVGDSRALRDAFAGMETACNNCHVRYRAL
ncbi:MAG: cytochrome c [Pseudomonadota bacterium]